MWSNTFRGWRTSFVNLFVLLTLVLNAAAEVSGVASVVPGVAPDLGLTLDMGAFIDANIVCYSTKLTFQKDTELLFTDEQLYGIAKMALAEMKTKFKADRIPPHRQPVMMAAMTVDKDIYISSSLKGNSFLYTHTNTRLKPEVVRALDRCQSGLQKSTKMPIDKEHRTKAACAEVMAVHQYYLDPDVPDAARKDPPPTRMVAYGTPPSGVAGPQAACGRGGQIRGGALTWGCSQFMADEGITVPRKPKPADIKVPYPFPGFMSNQISIMAPKYYNRD
ncbi:hypothetical protein LZ32DRAFT_682538 [Colletotrichum eremochloae]|nr:hypothetical protein LZ32DRAFT_682538 [Colletotrichum eremochloae]